MPRPIRLSQLRRNVQFAGGRVIFPMTEITDGVVTTGGKLTYEDNGVDIQSQLDSLTTAISGIHGHTSERVYYVDSKRVDAYTEDGSTTKPYKTLSAALTAKLGQSATDYCIFMLMPGNYDGVISIDKDAQNQSFEIIGSGSKNTFIRGAAAFNSNTGNVLFFRDFYDITLTDVTVMNGLYGFYPRSCRKICVQNCEFQYLGSDGEEKSHDQSGSQVEQAAFWASNQTSNGGTMRVRACQDVQIENCRTSYCLRGFRIQDCDSGFITNCRAYRLLESAFYLASGAYDGTSGSKNFVISGCEARDIFHSGYLVIGGYNNTITGCTAVNCTSSAFNGWHTQDLRIIGCVADNCTSKDYIGIGVLGDSYGQVYVAGKTNITSTGGYELTALNNCFTRCGVGRAAASTMFYLLDDAGLASSRFIIDGNHTDATTKLHNPDGITEVLGQYPAAAGGDISQAEFDALEIIVDDNEADIATNTAAVATNTAAVATNTAAVATNTAAVATKLGMSNNSVTITQGQGADTSIYLKRNGDTKQFSITRKSSYTKWKTIGGGKEHFLTHDDGRFDFKEGITRLAPISSTPSENAGNAKGGFWYDSSSSPGVLKWHDGVSWKTVTLS